MLIANATGAVIVEVGSGRVTQIDVPFEVVWASDRNDGRHLLNERVTERSRTACFDVHRWTAARRALNAGGDPAKRVNPPLVSPDGSKFLYFIWGPEERLHGKLHVFDFSSGADAAITPEVDVDRADITQWENAVWSPDSSSIAVELYTIGDNNVAVLPASGGPHVVVGPAFPTGTNGAAIRFSPDGQSLLVTYRHNNTTWLLPVAGGEGRQVTWAAGEDIDWQRRAP